MCVRTSEHELQQFLDEFFEIQTKRRFVKSRYTEVSKAELDQYPFYKIEPRILDENQSVFFDMKRPECTFSETCPWGAKIVSPIRIPEEMAKALGVGVVSCSWELDVVLLLSQEVKRLFEESNLTGLRYEACEIGSAQGTHETAAAPVYAAWIQPRIYSRAEDIVIAGPYCAQHGIITKSNYLFNEQSAVFEDADFQIIDRVRVGNHEYSYNAPLWVVSSRVVKLLLREKVKGLKRCTIVRNEKFTPVVYL